MVYIILGQGFEEAEATVPFDILRRGGAEVKFAGIGGLEITGSHGITVRADCTVEEIDAASAEMIVVPGGMGGVESIIGSDTAMNAVKTAFDAGKFVAAICAGPMVLGKLGILEGKKAVCYPGMERYLTGARPTQRYAAVTDGKVITGRGPGAAYDFGFALLAALKGDAAAKKVAGDMCWK